MFQCVVVEIYIYMCRDSTTGALDLMMVLQGNDDGVVDVDSTTKYGCTLGANS